MVQGQSFAGVEADDEAPLLPVDLHPLDVGVQTLTLYSMETSFTYVTAMGDAGAARKVVAVEAPDEEFEAFWAEAAELLETLTFVLD